MTRFELKAIAPGGTVEAVELQAADRASAVRSAENRGYAVLSVRERPSLAMTWRRAERFPVVLFSQELRVLVGAGLPLVESIDALAAKERVPAFRGVLQRVAGALREGKPFSGALESCPEAFPPLLVATVRAAERTSDLAPALARYVAYAQALQAVRKRIVSASVYPALLSAVGGLVLLFLLFYVVPRFGHIYEERVADLPFFSRALLAWGQAVQAHSGLVLAALAAGAAGVICAVRLPGLHGRLVDLAWRVPALGERMKVCQLARFYRTVGMLLRGGLPLVAALELAAELLHPALRVRLAAARQAISEGRAVSASLDASGLTTPVAIRLLAAGERSGSLGEMLETVAAFHDEEIARWVDWFTRLFEPLLMAAIGLVIGVIVILMYLPIFELAGGLS